MGTGEANIGLDFRLYSGSTSEQEMDAMRTICSSSNQRIRNRAMTHPGAHLVEAAIGQTTPRREVPIQGIIEDEPACD